ncbi:MAG: hypothetical protein KKE23_04040 [Nanoarchaeota archaeon]|nr:hypothetical protein [Nanoarchaeota archaeon]
MGNYKPLRTGQPDLKNVLENPSLVEGLCKKIQTGVLEGNLQKWEVENLFSTARANIANGSFAYQKLYALGEAIGVTFPVYATK